MLALWDAAVALPDRSERFLNDHYFTNAAMHGSGDENLEPSLAHCIPILGEQISTLSPRVIVACGENAANSLNALRLLRQSWPEFNRSFSSGAYVETTRLRKGVDASVFCTYHTSKGAVSRSVGPYRYRPDLTERLLAERRTKLSDQRAFDDFLARYGDIGNREHQGMRVLLLHWLDIGEAIRSAHQIRDRELA
jgi:uracil-DNA glycosylase